MDKVVVSGVFEDINSRTFRFLEEAARRGAVEVLLWSDALATSLLGEQPTFSLVERQYVMDALRYVDTVTVLEELNSVDDLPTNVNSGVTWVVDEASACEGKRAFCESQALGYHVVHDADLAGYPERPADPPTPGRKRIVVTGCYDWFHSGHVRFFEEVSEHDDLYVIVGHDDNLRLLKGEGHPLFPEDERRYMAQSIRFVTQALVSSGHGWMDAEPEIKRLKMDAYAVNEDGDHLEKREFCEKHDLEYLVLKREPKPGLTRRTSTDLRGF